MNNAGNAICTCEPGLIPKPDTITGCGPECVRDPDCQQGKSYFFILNIKIFSCISIFKDTFARVRDVL